MVILSSGVKTETTIQLKKSKIENLFAFRGEGILHNPTTERHPLPPPKKPPQNCLGCATSQNKESGHTTLQASSQAASKQKQEGLIIIGVLSL